ncbi:MAG: 50S ribosomal protein L34e [Candidatus Woesearchaeota archaeon]|nr:50S ribosomal protein L34e [Candidatus Woesearchaeota archaeon]
MPAGSRKSHTYRRVFQRVPSGVSRLFYKKRKPSKAVCGSCKLVLPGVACATPRKMQNMSKSSKRPERPFGGVLCTRCMRSVMVAKARSMKLTE